MASNFSGILEMRRIQIEKFLRNFLVQLIEQPILGISNILFVYFLSNFPR